MNRCLLEVNDHRYSLRILRVQVFKFFVGSKKYVAQMNRVRNEEVRRRAGIKRELASRADQRVVRWFGHVERMDEYRWPEEC